MAHAVVAPNSELLAELGILSAAGTGRWDGAVLRLFKSPMSLTGLTALADFEEADFTGYAASAAIVWATPIIAPSGEPVVNGDAKDFVGGSPLTTANTVFGWYVTDDPATVWYFGRVFDTPIGISEAGQGLVVVPSIPVMIPS